MKVNYVERINRLQRLLKLLEGKITGRKKLHKLIYLAQKKGINFGHEFIFHHYGVYSPGLSMDVSQGEELEIFEEDNISTSSGSTYELKLLNDKELASEDESFLYD